MAVIEKYLDRFLQSREPPKTFCPSEVARALTSSELHALGVTDWRGIMSLVRLSAEERREQGELEVLQKGNIVDLNTAIEDIRGPIRLRRTVSTTDT